STAAPAPATSSVQLEQRVETLSGAISAAQQRLADSQAQILQLQTELQQLRALMTHPETPAVEVGAAAAPAATSSSSSVSIEERVQTLEAAVKVHDQIKVESRSKYPVRLTGLLLFNSSLNLGVPDTSDLPEVALAPTSTSGNGSLGASLRQTVLGIEADGPRIGGARTSASVDFDFFGGLAYSNYGSVAGIVRLRTASVNFDWANDSLSVGMAPPLISPLSPTSYATVAEPALAGAGNLWTWAPQLRYAHRTPLRNGRQLQAEFGLWDSPAAGYSTNPNLNLRTASPGEISKQPAFETRLSYGRSQEHSYAGGQGLQVGVSGYYSRQIYPGYSTAYTTTANLDSWAATLDWRLPLMNRFEISGEGYRGRALGGLGGGVYKNAIIGTDPRTGLPALRGLNAIGGWTQFKTRLGPLLEANASIGLDDGLARDFHAVLLPLTATADQLRARNKMVLANMIFKPKTYIILSPEYRRIWTWPITGRANTVDVFTLAVGYQF
ncbi:MAG: hypothetical protein M3R43_04545, partial [Acidobacteriota bacterium]|nr:hypothetical protein [Acidobacteriota bacterium]